jgi:acyl-CoA hydrolase
MADYKSKLMTVDEALAMINSNDVITTAMAGAEPVLFMSRIHTIADRVRDVTITCSLPSVQGEYLTEFEKYQHAFKIDSWFYTPQLRKYHKTGRISFIPNCLHYAAEKRLVNVHNNIFVSSASMPDEDGYVRLSCSNVYEMQMARASDKIFLEISPNIPKMYGDQVFHISEVTGLIESDYFLPQTPDVTSSEKDKQIGRYIADLINDGDCIQIGIGGIPNAVCDFIEEKRDLGVHTEMMTTGIMRLMRKGIVNNSRKQVDKGKTICCFAYGTQEMYEFLHENPEVEIRAGSLVNDPYVIARNDNQVSINTTIEIDLTGQCCSESIGYLQFSGTGGQSDTVIGAQNSKNGRSFIALHSTAMVKNESGEREEISKVVPILKPGAVVSLSRNDVDYVVTEWGCCRLKGKSVIERAEALISIAHPKFRSQLREAAKQYQFWF